MCTEVPTIIIIDYCILFCIELKIKSPRPNVVGQNLIKIGV